MLPRLPLPFVLATPVLVGCLSSSSSPAPIDAGAFDASIPSPDAAALPDAPSNDDGATFDASPGSALDAASPPQPAGALGTGQLTAPQHIAVDPTTGNLYVASFAGSYSVLTPTGTLVGTYGTGGANALKSAVGIARDASGNVYVGDYGASAVLVFDSTGAYKATFDGSKSGVTLGRITGVAIDSSGAIAAVDDDNGRIVRFDATGAVLGQIATEVDGGAAAGTTAIAVEGTDLWVTKYYDHSVIHIDASGAIVGVFGTAGTGTAGTFSQPYAIARDANGRLYIADNGADTVQTMTTTGTFGWIVSASGDAGATQPTGVAVSPDGAKLYVSDGAGNRIVVYAL